MGGSPAPAVSEDLLDVALEAARAAAAVLVDRFEAAGGPESWRSRMRRWFDQRDRRALLVGAAALLVLTATYPIYADIATRPLAVFIFPGLITAVLGGWRPTVMVGVAAFAAASNRCSGPA